MELLVSHEHESLGTIWGQLMRLGCPVSARTHKSAEGMEAQTHTTDVPPEPCATHRYFHFNEALLKKFLLSFGNFFRQCYALLVHHSLAPPKKSLRTGGVNVLWRPPSQTQVPPFSGRQGWLWLW